MTVPAGIIHAVRNVGSGNAAELATYVVEDETTEVVMSRSVEAATNIRPFRVEFPADAVEDLRRRVAAARWPSKELVADRSQGVQLEALQALARYWLNEYDFGRVEARLNALPQFVTEIDGVDVHFLHIRSPHDDALPLIMTHGWPGSVIEMLDSVGPLTDPTAHGGSAEDAFHLVLPSLPGYGFSSEPVELGWDLGRTARAWAELMRRLGYTRFVAQGGDVGAGVTDAMGRQEPAGLIGIHTNLLVPALSGPMPTDTAEERAAAAQIATFRQSGNGYFVEMATRPQTIGYALLDSPIALAAWMVDHDTDAYYKIASAFVDGRPSGNLTRDHILDNVTLYRLAGSGVSAGTFKIGTGLYLIVIAMISSSIGGYLAGRLRARFIGVRSDRCARSSQHRHDTGAGEEAARAVGVGTAGNARTAGSGWFLGLPQICGGHSAPARRHIHDGHSLDTERRRDCRGDVS